MTGSHQLKYINGSSRCIQEVKVQTFERLQLWEEILLVICKPLISQVNDHKYRDGQVHVVSILAAFSWSQVRSVKHMSFSLPCSNFHV